VSTVSAGHGPGPAVPELVEADPFGTAALRAAVLAAWAASPTRFREDANVEEDLRLDGYADAWFVELAQNAADAARAGGVDGRLRVRLVEGGADGRPELRVANTGAPLNAAGVAALASLRASAKRDDAASVGRFGVGFTAVLAVSDAPQVLGSGGGVAFSAARTAAAVRALPGPAAELARRDEPPVLRLAWPSAEAPPAGFDTEVRLPLRAGVDGATLLAQARDSVADLLLVLPELVEIEVAGEAIRRTAGPPAGAGDTVIIGERRWQLVRLTGSLAAVDARAQATEQRTRRDWAVCWALPLTARGDPEPLTDDVLHAPTATAERLGLPARLIATVPLEPDRRRVRTGPATDQVLAGAARAYLDLVRALPPARRVALVPTPGFPRSELDGRLRELLLDALRGAAWLPGADGAELVPGRAEWLDLPGAEPALGQLLAAAGFDRLLGPLALGPQVAGPQVAGPRSAGPRSAGPEAAGSIAACPHPAGPEAAGPLAAGPQAAGPLAAGPAAAGAVPLGTLLTALGVHRLGAAELVSRLLGVEQPAGWWRALYAALEPIAATVPGLLDELRALPVPLADGRAVAGPATVLLPAPAAPGADAAAGAAPDPVALVAALALPGLHIADAAAVHPLLRRLGAELADPAVLMEHPALAAAIERSVDDADAGLDPAPLADAVLALVAHATAGAGPAGVLGALALPDAEGYPSRADELMLPAAVLRPLLAPDTPIGVLDPAWARRFDRSVWTAVGVLDGFALVVDENPVGPDHDLDDEERWWATLDTPPARLLAIRDLDLIDDAAWPRALALLAAGRDTRAAVTAAGSYTAWWLARHARLDGHRPTHYRLPSATRLAALYDPVPVERHTLAAPGGDSGRDPIPDVTPDAALDGAFLAAVGVRADLTVRDARAAADLLGRLADPERTPEAALVAQAHAALAAAVAAGRVHADDFELPERVRALDGSVVDVELAVVLDAPWPAAVLTAGELVIGGDPFALAELLDLPLATEVVAAEVEGAGRPVRWAAIAEVVVACHTIGVGVPDGEILLHDELWVTVHRPLTGRHRVPTWVDDRGRWHAQDPLRALLALLAVEAAGETAAAKIDP
jgi:hypothetical protein